MADSSSAKRSIDETGTEGAEGPPTRKSPADELICPITLELPFEPVTAEDGRYDRKRKNY